MQQLIDLRAKMLRVGFYLCDECVLLLDGLQERGIAGF